MAVIAPHSGLGCVGSNARVNRFFAAATPKVPCVRGVPVCGRQPVAAQGMRRTTSDSQAEQRLRANRQPARVPDTKAMQPLMHTGVPVVLSLAVLQLLGHSSELQAGYVLPLQEMAGSWAGAIMHLPTNCWDGYCSLLDTNPVMTKVLTGLVGCFIGDLLAQTTGHVLAEVEHKKRLESGQAGNPPVFVYNYAHTLRLLFFSSMTTPFLQQWYLMLDALVMPDQPSSPQAVMIKVLCDQGLLTPITTGLFFVVMRVMEDVTGGLAPEEVTPGNLLARVQSTLSAKYVPTMKACYMLWPLAHVVNFALVPSSQRILYINAVAIMWTAFLSLQTAASSSDPDSVEAEATKQ